MKKPEQENVKPLWTKDFTILTLGSVVSMVGSALTGFAMSLMVLDYTGSPFLYAIYMAVYILPQIVMPIFSGAILDRFSRRKTIYTLDFTSAGLYVVMAGVLSTGWFNFPIFAVFCFFIGAINSVYMVAYQSFYPLLISEGNYSKAYSISSVLESLSFVVIPLSALIYNTLGIIPLLIIDAVSYFIAAVMETRITAQEDYIQLQKQNEKEGQSSGRRMFSDIREGFRYLVSERGLLAVAAYFLFSSLSWGAVSAITLPWFESTFGENGEYWFILVQGFSVVGRAIGGAIHYKLKLPVKRKYTIALCVYICLGLIGATYLYLPVWLMMVFCLLQGLLGVTSYTIRISATQSYVPDEKKGRFNGAFNVLSTVGNFVGTLVAGGMATAIPPRLVITIFLSVEVLMAIVLIGGSRRHIAPIYNRQQ